MLWYALTWTASNLSSLCSRLAALSLSVLTSWFLISRTRWRLAASWLRVIFLKFVVFVYTVHYYYRRMTGPLGAVLWIPVTFWYAPLTNGSGSCYFRPWLSRRHQKTDPDPGDRKTYGSYGSGSTPLVRSIVDPELFGLILYRWHSFPLAQVLMIRIRTGSAEFVLKS
jgi:hypothetical protein